MMREHVNQMDGLWGLMVGDALGVPAEFKDREMLRRMPVMMMNMDLLQKKSQKLLIKKLQMN